MGCCLGALLAVLAPRIILVLLFFLTDFLNRAFHHQLLLLVLGFLFLPLTTLVYAWIVNVGAPLAGIYVLILIVAVILDVGSWGGGHYSRRRS
jgi:uncharacterized oligopeptide transporter (OPT) family protein